MASKITPELLDRLSFELEIRAEYPDKGEMIVNVGEMREYREALVWAADEIAQLREDLIGSTGACMSLTQENIDLNLQVTILSTLLGLGKSAVAA